MNIGMVYFLIIVLAFMITLISIPLIIRFAKKSNIYDLPGKIKPHKKPIPYLGGIGIYLGFLITTVIASLIFDISQKETNQIIFILIGATILLIIGLLDDLKKINAIYKLIFELIIVLLIFFIGLKISIFTNWYISLLTTVIWAIYIINAFNNIDGMDGLSSGIAIISSITFAIIYSMSGSIPAVILSLSLLGSCLAFLIFNWNPAKIFMGDSGSLFIGFILASIPLIGFINTPNLITGRLIPIIILGYILFDTAFVFSLRIINKKNPLSGDLNHTYNLLQNKIKNTKKTVLIIYIINILLSITAIMLLFVR